MFDIQQDLLGLFDTRGVVLEPCYRRAITDTFSRMVSYNTPVMHGMIMTLFSDKRMIAYNLLQNAIDEAKGAARVKIMADRYATGDLLRQMRAHVGDEFRHSKLFAACIAYTGHQCQADESPDAAAEVQQVCEFDDELMTFMARVHSIEIRSWTMLRHYKQVLMILNDAQLNNIVPIIEQIMSDEIEHVYYTGKQLNHWLHEQPDFAEILLTCFKHTHKETWHDLGQMTEYLHEMEDTLQCAA